MFEGPKHPNVLDAVRRLGIGLLCWAPLASGFLVDGFTTDGSSRTTSAALAAGASERREIAAHARDAAAQGRTLRRYAIAWVLEQPG